MAGQEAQAPITIAIVDDYDIVLAGVAHMLAPYSARVLVVELDANKPVGQPVDIALYDAFAQPEVDHEEIAVLLKNPWPAKVVVYTWNFNPVLVETARLLGVAGYLSKALPAAALVDSLETVHAGHVVISAAPARGGATSGLDWPGRGEGLTERESEILALITQGKSNAEIVALTYLSPNTVKSYIRTIYRRIEVSSRTQAVIWGVRHGFTPDYHRIDGWRPSG